MLVLSILIGRLVPFSWGSLLALLVWIFLLWIFVWLAPCHYSSLVWCHLLREAFHGHLLKKYVYLAVSGLGWGMQCLAMACGLSCFAACGILVSRPGIKPIFSALQGRFLTTGPPGKPLHDCLNQRTTIHVWPQFLNNTNLIPARIMPLKSFHLVFVFGCKSQRTK